MATKKVYAVTSIHRSGRHLERRLFWAPTRVAALVRAKVLECFRGDGPVDAELLPREDVRELLRVHPGLWIEELTAGGHLVEFPAEGEFDAWLNEDVWP
jgi:hypothetical protein